MKRPFIYTIPNPKFAPVVSRVWHETFKEVQQTFIREICCESYFYLLHMRFCFSLSALRSITVFGFCHFDDSVSWWCYVQVFIHCLSLGFLGQCFNIPFHIGEVLTYYFFNQLSSPLSLSPGIHMILMLFHLVLSIISLLFFLIIFCVASALLLGMFNVSSRTLF